MVLPAHFWIILNWMNRKGRAKKHHFSNPYPNYDLISKTGRLEVVSSRAVLLPATWNSKEYGLSASYCG